MGAWVSYALGTENNDLPAFVAIPDPRGVPQSSVNNWGAGFPARRLPGNAVQQQPADPPSRATARRCQPGGRSRHDATCLKLLNERHLAQFPGDTELSARIASYEMAARMQLSVPRIMDLSSESRATLRRSTAPTMPRTSSRPASPATASSPAG